MGLISQLPREVINRIAAGEVLVRPANAVKELIENSLDAGATEISVTMKNGGLDMIQVQDNGKGFLKDDLKLACVRFATSKLQQFEDLMNMHTYGFRGEALASLSLVTIISRTVDQQCAYIATYREGNMSTIKASAGNQGTVITAEELFHDAPARRQSMRKNEEGSRIEDVVTRYAVHRPDVSFALRGGSSVYRTKGDGDRMTVISALIGNGSSKNMINLDHSSKTLKYRLTGALSEPISIATATNELARKNRRKSFMIFINGRSVTCSSIRLAMDALFHNKDLICPFILISLELEPNRIDVNAHPTKEEVIFLEEEAIVEDISQVSTSKTNGNQNKEKRVDHSQVRTDHLERRLDAFIMPSTSVNTEVELVKVRRSTSGNSANNGEEEIVQKRDLQLESIYNLRKEICSGASSTLREIFKEHTFVGCCSPELALIQFGTSLYIIKLNYILQEFFYQIIVFGFGNLGHFKFDDPLSVAELYLMSMEDGTNSELINHGVELLTERAEMLSDYYSLSFEMLSVNGEEVLHLTGIPSIFSGYLPQLEGLPQLINRLVNCPWNTDEQTCLKAICKEIANLFVIKEEFCEGSHISSLPEGCAQWIPLIRDHILPRIKMRLIPQESFKENGIIAKIVDQHSLYTIFERC